MAERVLVKGISLAEINGKVTAAQAAADQAAISANVTYFPADETERLALSPSSGERAFQQDTQKIYEWNGSSWDGPFDTGISGKANSADLGTAAEKDVEDFASKTARIRHRSIAYTPVSGRGTYQGSGVSSTVLVSHADLQAFGITGSKPFGTNGSTATIYKRDLVPADISGAQVAAYVFVYSDGGTSWPSGTMKAVPYDAATGGSTVAGVVTRDTGYIQMSTNVRLYWGLWTLPATSDIGSIAYGFDTVVTAASAEIGGWGLFVSQSDVDMENITFQDWRGYLGSDRAREQLEAGRIREITRGVGRGRLSNLVLNPTLDPDLGPVTGAGSVTFGAPTSADLAALGVTQVANLGAGGGNGFVQHNCLHGGLANKQALLTVLVSAADGLNWPNLVNYWYAGASSVGAANLSSFLAISATTRLYYVQATIPNNAGLTHIRIGTANAAATVCEMSGIGLFADETTIAIEDVEPLEWNGEAGLYGAVVAESLRTKRGGFGPFRNYSALFNGQLDPKFLTSESVNGNAEFTGLPGSPFMEALGVKNTINLGDSGAVPGGNGYLAIPVDGKMAAKEFLFTVLLTSNAAGSWPATLNMVWYSGGTSRGTFAMVGNYELVAPNTRRYYVTGTVPNYTDLTTIRVGTGAGVTGAEVLMGGPALFLDDADTPALAQVPLKPFNEDTLDPDMLFLASKQALPLRGKRIVMMGDSIIGNYNVVPLVGTYCAAETISAGFGGTRMAYEDEASGLSQYKEYFCFVRLANAINTGVWTDQIDAADDMVDLGGAAPGSADDYRDRAAALAALDWSTVDVIMVGYGTNDFNADGVLGLAGSTTETDFYGALNEGIRLILEAYPHIRIVLMTPMWRGASAGYGDSNVNQNSVPLYLADYQAAIRERAAYYQIPCLPLHELIGINKFNASDYLTTDTIHPSVPLGRDRWVKVVSSWLNSMM